MGCSPSSYPTVTTQRNVVTRTYPQSFMVQSSQQAVQSQTIINFEHNNASLQISRSVPVGLSSTKPTEAAEITEDVVKSFQALSVVISEMERKNIIARLDAEVERQNELQKDITELNQQYSMLDAKTKKEFADVSKMNALSQSASVSKYFASQHDFEAQFSKEEEEFIQAKTEQENCYQRLVKLQELNSQLSVEIDRLKREKNDLLDHYAKQDALLESIFGGTYGSTLEDELEGELDKMEGKHRNIRMAMEKWKNAEALVDRASGQLKFSCKRWFDVQRIPNKGNTQMVRIQAIGETRNHLIAAARNLTSAQRYLHPVKMPYCDASEVATLNKAITFIYIDGTSRDRHHHAMQVYQTTNARSIMLQKWIKNVIDQRISQDLAQMRVKCNECRASLRNERVSLMMKKVEEETGKTMEITWSESPNMEAEPEETVDLNTVAQADELEDVQNLDEQIEKAKAENEEKDVDAAATLALASAETEKADKATLEELAPAPSRNELFGDLDTIMAAYDQQKQTLESEHQSAKAKQEAAIQAKLRKRRSKVMRLEG